MSYVDLQQALREWPYEPERISVRKILGTDGAIRIQMRVELGMLQMEAEGRPDGAKMYGYDSLLAYHRAKLSGSGESDHARCGYRLSREDCQALRIEASLYYRRYIAFFVLEEYDHVVEDTSHSLSLFDLCRDYALDEDDRCSLEEFRPYVLMMTARARAYQAMEDGEPASALAHVNRGILSIKSHFERYRQADAEPLCEELRILRALGSELSERVPKDSLLVTRKALRSAIEQERFEEAARLRDALKNRLEQQG